MEENKNQLINMFPSYRDLRQYITPLFGGDEKASYDFYNEWREDNFKDYIARGKPFPTLDQSKNFLIQFGHDKLKDQEYNRNIMKKKKYF
jgi:hypothetical protein